MDLNIKKLMNKTTWILVVLMHDIAEEFGTPTYVIDENRISGQL